MPKKLSLSSQPERRRSMTSEDIANRKWTDVEKKAVRGTANRQAAEDDSQISFKDIPPLTPEQLAGMTRLRDRRLKISVSVRLDAQVVDWLKSKGEGHLTRINDILTNLIELESRR